MNEKPNFLFLPTLLAVGILPLLLNGFINPHLLASPYLFWLLDFSIWILLPAMLYVLFRRYNHFTLNSIGFSKHIWGESSLTLVVLLTLIVTPLILFCYFVAFRISLTFYPGEASFTYHLVLPETGYLRVIATMYLALTAGFIEEAYFRGGIFLAVSNLKYSTITYLLISPALFSFGHWENGAANLIATFIVGTMMSAIYLKLRNLWPLVFAHVLADLLVFG